MNRRRIAALAATDVRAALRDGEQLLLTLGIPVALLVFFGTIDVLPTNTDDPVDFLAPGLLALALMSMAFVRLAIGLGFDRSFGAIKRFAITPLRVSEFLAAKLAVTVMLFSAQVVILALIAAALGWRPAVHVSLLPAALLALLAFVGLAFAIAGVVDGLKALAVANALYILLLLVSGIVFDLAELPSWLEATVRLLPSTAIAELFRATLGGAVGPGWAWITLAGWAIITPVGAVRVFRWE